MRPRRLELSGIGPFAGTPVVVDFTVLGPLFLVTGATGAGKTTLFDALSYALYGKPLGTRHTSTLRAKRAREDESTSVSLELEAHGTRYRVSRSPHHPRRGRGGRLVVEQYAQLSRERAADDGTMVFDVIAEGAAQVDAAIARDVVKLEHEEFSKILVLPQGEFQQFLEMGTTQRASLLEKLFPTTLHRAITARAQDRAKTLALRAAELSQRLAGVSDASDAPFEAREAAAGAAVDAARGAAAQTRALALAATEARVHGLALLADFEQRDALEAAHEAHEARDGEIASFRARLARAHAANAVESVLRTRDAERARLLAIEARAAETKLRLDAERAKSAELARRAEALSATARAEDEREEARLASVDATVSVLAHALARQPDALAHGSTEAPPQPDTAGRLALEIEVEETALREARAALARIAPLAATCERLRGLVQLEIPKLEEAVRVASTARAEALRAEQEANGALALRDAAVAQAHAADLAAHLADGQPCPVCGSETHPTPAARGEGEQAALRARDAARRAHDAAREARTRADRALEDAERAALVAKESARALTGQLVDAGFADADAVLRARETLGVEVDRYEASLARVLARAAAGKRALEREAGALRAALAERRAALVAVRGELAACEGRQAELERGLAQDATAHEAAGAALARAEADAADALQREAFFREDEVRAHAVPAEALRTMTVAIEAHVTEGARIEGALSTLRARTQDAARPSREALLERERRASDDASAAAAEVRRAEDALTELRAREATRVALLAERAALEAEGEAMHALARDLAGENAQKVDFATYALALWLEDVLDRASSRFSRLTDERYTFVLHEGLSHRQRKAGLDIDVHDAREDASRSVRTLSGGEKFLAALALALGLADTVSARAGGIELDMLLIDEGFGHLDADALARVLTVLDDLGAGRQVGVVSHVEALTREIPSQVRVVTSLEGSRVEVSV